MKVGEGGVIVPVGVSVGVNVTVGVKVTVGVEVIVECFIVVVVGGLGSVQGALIAALIIGQLEVFGIMFIEELSMIFIYVLMGAVLLYKPRGLFGKKVGEY